MLLSKKSLSLAILFGVVSCCVSFSLFAAESFDSAAMTFRYPMGAVAALYSSDEGVKTADVVFVVDESESMKGGHAWLKEMVGDLGASLQAYGMADNRYALVGFGGGGSHFRGHKHSAGSGFWGTADELGVAISTLRSYEGMDIEDGWEALSFALQQYEFRENASVNIILITNEDRDNFNFGVTYQSVLTQFTTHDARLHLVVNANFADSNAAAALGTDWESNAYLADGNGGYLQHSGGKAIRQSGTTIADYINLALPTEGSAWDINLTSSGGLLAQSFTTAIAKVIAMLSTELAPQENLMAPGVNDSVSSNRIKRWVCWK